MEMEREEIEIGRVEHYFPHPQVAAVVLKGELRIGDTIHIKGHTTDFEQIVESMQIEHKPVEVAKAGDSVGIKVQERARPNDVVYKVVNP